MKILREGNTHQGVKFMDMVQGEVYEHASSGVVLLKMPHSAVDLSTGTPMYEMNFKSAYFTKVNVELVIK